MMDKLEERNAGRQNAAYAQINFENWEKIIKKKIIKNEYLAQREFLKTTSFMFAPQILSQKKGAGRANLLMTRIVQY